MGECSKEQSFALLDAFFKLGGNFIDTYVTCRRSGRFGVHDADDSSANNYQQEESEQWIGEWMTARGNRDQMVYVLQSLSMAHQP